MPSELLKKHEKRNIVETEILENQVIVLGKFLNPQEILFEFRLLKNFEMLF